MENKTKQKNKARSLCTYLLSAAILSSQRVMVWEGEISSGWVGAGGRGALRAGRVTKMTSSVNGMLICLSADLRASCMHVCVCHSDTNCIV